MTGQQDPPHIAEAKRASGRTGLVASVVIWFVLALFLWLPALVRHSHGHPFTTGFWVGVVAEVVYGALIVRLWLKHRARWAAR